MYFKWRWSALKLAFFSWMTQRKGSGTHSAFLDGKKAYEASVSAIDIHTLQHFTDGNRYTFVTRAPNSRLKNSGLGMGLNRV